MIICIMIPPGTSRSLFSVFTIHYRVPLKPRYAKSTSEGAAMIRWSGFGQRGQLLISHVLFSRVRTKFLCTYILFDTECL